MPGQRAPPAAARLRWAALSLAFAFSPAAWASAPRSISLYHTHTSERLSLVYYEDGEYIADALASLNGMLRDFRTGETSSSTPRCSTRCTP